MSVAYLKQEIARLKKENNLFKIEIKKLKFRLKELEDYVKNDAEPPEITSFNACDLG